MISSARMERLKLRRLDSHKKVGEMNEVYKSVNEETAIQYAIGAMQPIDPEYTSDTYEESKRIQNQLTQPLLDKDIPIEYQYQGSVSNDTHIKAHSDIDTLVIHKDLSQLSFPIN
jgi:tRNA nucleotidyltransferase (CCA-adding enzyme)